MHQLRGGPLPSIHRQVRVPAVRAGILLHHRLQALLELPAGLRDVSGEPEIDTARRELEEEVGHRAGSIEHLVTLATAVGFTDETIAVYLATDLVPTATRADGVEEQTMTIERVALGDVDRLIATGELTDAKSVAGLLVARQRLQG